MAVSNHRNSEPMLSAVPLTPAGPLPVLTLPATGGRAGVLRVLYLGRLSVAAAIFVAAIVVWRRADSSATLLATLAFVSTLLFTGGSMLFSEPREGHEPGNTFYYVQILFDLVLVTAVVHLTQTGTPSQLAPLY